MMGAALMRRVRVGVRRVGVPGMLAAALLLASAVLLLVVQPRQQSLLDETLARADVARRDALRRSRDNLAVADRARQPSVAQWLLELPALNERQPRVAGLLQRATQHGLWVKRSEFRFWSGEAVNATSAATATTVLGATAAAAEGAAAGVARYRVNLPVLGSYEGLRGYLQDALQADAALVLDGMRLRRNPAQAAQVQAELQFTLLMREAPMAPEVLVVRP